MSADKGPISSKDKVGGGGGSSGDGSYGARTRSLLYRLPKHLEFRSKHHKLGISDKGEYLEDKFLEHRPSQIASYFVGRKIAEPLVDVAHGKRVETYTSNDIVKEGYLYKRGTWFKTWKKRYFILRSDIHALRVYESRENLKLVASVQLNHETCIWPVPKAHVDDALHVVAISNGIVDTTSSKDLSDCMLIKFDSQEHATSWIVEMNSECDPLPVEEVGIDIDTLQFEIAPMIDHAKLNKKKKTPTVSLSKRFDKGSKPGNVAPSPKNIISVGEINSSSSSSITQGGSGCESINNNTTTINSNTSTITSTNNDDKNKNNNTTSTTTATTTNSNSNINSSSSPAGGARGGGGGEIDHRLVKKGLTDGSINSSASLGVRNSGIPSDDSDDSADEEESPVKGSFMVEDDLQSKPLEIRPSDFRDMRGSDLAMLSKLSPPNLPLTATIGSAKATTNTNANANKTIIESSRVSMSSLAAPTVFSVIRGIMDEKRGKIANVKSFKMTKPKNKPDKFSPIPQDFRTPHIDNLIVDDSTIIGTRLSFQLCHMGSTNDVLFARVFSDKQLDETSAPAASATGGLFEDDLANVLDEDLRPSSFLFPSVAAASSSSKVKDQYENKGADVVHDAPPAVATKKARCWEPLHETEVYRVTALPEYGASCIGEVTISFNIVQPPIPESSDYVMVVLYRHTGQTSVSIDELTLRQQSANQVVANLVVSRKDWNKYTVFRSEMKILVECFIDISSPILHKPRIVAGVSQLLSKSMFDCRKQNIQTWGEKPYAEKLFSFATKNGCTLSLDQVFVSDLAVSVADSMVMLISQERSCDFSKFRGILTMEDGIIVSKILSLLKVVVSQFNSNSEQNLQVKFEDPEYIAQLMKDFQVMLQTNVLDRDIVDYLGKYNELSANYTSLLGVIESMGNLEDDILNEEMEQLKWHLIRCAKGQNKKGVVIDQDCGGGKLRRSVWKKESEWQYNTINLNAHYMISRNFQVSDIEKSVILSVEKWSRQHQQKLAKIENTKWNLDNLDNSGEEVVKEESSSATTLAIVEGNSNSNSGGETATKVEAPESSVSPLDEDIHYVPLLTLGCPAAHALKFTNGGLRRLLHPIDINEGNLKNRLLWLQVLQMPYSDAVMTDMLTKFPREFSALFGIVASLPLSIETRYQILTKKIEFARRIDMVGSQILGFALTQIRMIISLSMQVRGEYFEALQRSLKIGFLCPLQSFLTSQGPELGMIEDLDVASEWLRLVSVRIVQRSAKPTRPTPNRQDSSCCYGYSGCVLVRRDSNGRIIVDLEVDDSEAACIKEAYEVMRNFEFNIPDSIPRSSSRDPSGGGGGGGGGGESDLAPLESVKRSLEFSGNPTVRYQEGEILPTVIGVVELFGAAYSQGVNEMQTYAIMTGAKDIDQQTQINNKCILSLETYYNRYKLAFLFQFNQFVNTILLAIPMESLKNVSSDLKRDLKKSEEFSDRIFREAQDAISAAGRSQNEKHCDVILKLNKLCRRMSSTVGIICKSGKDRTGMGVTLETTKSLVEDLGVVGGSATVSFLRQYGVRKMNVWANTGQEKFAFNTIQKMNLPTCFQPPAGTHAGSVKS